MNAPVLLPEADADLDAIWTFIAERSTAAADRTLERILAAIERLGEWPNLGHARPDLTTEPYRFYTSDRATVVYECHDGRVYVARLLYLGRQLER